MSMIIAALVDRIEIGENYEVHIHLNTDPVNLTYILSGLICVLNQTRGQDIGGDARKTKDFSRFCASKD